MYIKAFIALIWIVLGSTAPIKAQSTEKSAPTHALRLIPLGILDADGMGMGIAYEGMINTAKTLSINVPFTYIISNKQSKITGLPQSNYLYFNPGLKYYFYKKSKISLAAGPSYYIGYGYGNTRFIEWNLHTVHEHDFQKIRMGILANGYFHAQLSKRIDVGFEIGLGIRLMDYHNNFQYGKTHLPNTSSGNFAIHFGYLF